MSGRLSLVAVPIGNMGDMTFRAVEVLKAAERIAAEDTRRARRLLDHFDISTRSESYHSHNEYRKTADLVQYVLDGGHLAMLSDAGTPVLSDPGYVLVREALAAGIEPEIIPGVSALTMGVAGSGLPVHQFTFAGFLPKKSGRRMRYIEELLARGETIFVFESPHRVTKLLAELIKVGGPNVKVALMRELTKDHEEILRGTAEELLAKAPERWRGEFTVGFHPAEQCC